MLPTLIDKKFYMNKHSENERVFIVFSGTEIKEHPFELFKSEHSIQNFINNKENLDSKIEWALEYEMIYNSYLFES
ncbi:MAG: hypothetical protein N3D80_05950 [Ignavibacterium album]|uniref:hypothetical protein n=1 Tax=Ignavibacterium album TaxID=591197 RepID=UPI0026F0B630|nr:hypothetical protein [Ignavibacterium album]MCX8105403.1 hypothetical protein [Ignavibacterium album]